MITEDLANVSGGTSVKSELLAGRLLSMALLGGIGLNSSIASAESGKGALIQTDGKGQQQGDGNEEEEANSSDNDNDNDNANTNNDNVDNNPSNNNNANANNNSNNNSGNNNDNNNSNDNINSKSWFFEASTGTLTVLTDEAMQNKEWEKSISRYQIKRVVLASGVTLIGTNVFECCSSLTQIDIPSNFKLTCIGKAAFNSCKKFKNIDMQEAQRLTFIP